MLKQNSAIKISAAAGLCRFFSGLLMLLILSLSMLAQENTRVSKESLSDGITLQLQGREVTEAGNYLVIGDSSRHAMALRQISLDGNPLWMKRSEDAVELPNVIHWFDDEKSGLLTIDISGIRDRLASQSQLEIVVVPFLPDAPGLLISLYRSNQQSNTGAEDLQKIKDVNVEIN